MIKGISLSFSGGVIDQFEKSKNPPSAFEMAMRYVAALNLMICGGGEFMPNPHESCRKLFTPGCLNGHQIRQHLLRCQRVAMHIRNDRIDHVRFEASFYSRGSKQEIAQIIVLIDPDGKPVQTSWTHTANRQVLAI